MIRALIHWSVGNRFFVLLATAILVGTGLFAVRNTPVDAIPDLSDVQVIIKTSYPGQAPQVVEDFMLCYYEPFWATQSWPSEALQRGPNAHAKRARFTRRAHARPAAADPPASSHGSTTSNTGKMIPATGPARSSVRL